MRFFTAALLALASTVALASSPAQDPGRTLAKQLATRYLDIAAISADARVNKNLYCEDGTYTSEITENTVKAILSARNSADSAFATQIVNSIKSNKALQEVVAARMSYRMTLVSSVLGYDLKAEKAALIGSVMYGPARGAMGNISEIKFGNATSALITTKNMDDNGEVTYKKQYVTYSVSLNSSYAAVVTIADKAYLLRQTATGYILIPDGRDDDSGAYEDGYVEDASECEA